MEKIRTGLWRDKERGGYGCGKPVEIGGQPYWINLYKNDRKESDSHPDLNLVLKPAGPPRQAGMVDKDLDQDIPF